jgi:O-methyltransferase
LIAHHTVLNRFKVANIHTLLRKTLDAGLEGDVGECGVYKGGVSLLMAKTIVDLGLTKKVFMFDSFLGLPELNQQKDLPFYRAGALKATMISVQEAISELSVKEIVDVRPGWFKDVLPKLQDEQRFAFLHIDCDLYDSTKTCLEQLYDRVVEGGVMVFDDYFDVGGGERKAVDEFLENRDDELLFAGPIEQVFFFKGRQKRGTDSGYLLPWTGYDDGRPVSLEFIAKDSAYLNFLAEGQFMTELPGGSLSGAVRLATQTLAVYRHHQAILEMLTGKPMA